MKIVNPVYEIPSKQIYLAEGSSYSAHGVKKGQRIAFDFQGNFLIGNVVGCGPKTLLIQVQMYS